MGSLSPYIPPIFTILQEYHNITRVLTNVKVSSLAAVKYFLNAFFVKKKQIFSNQVFSDDRIGISKLGTFEYQQQL